MQQIGVLSTTASGQCQEQGLHVTDLQPELDAGGDGSHAPCKDGPPILGRLQACGLQPDVLAGGAQLAAPLQQLPCLCQLPSHLLLTPSTLPFSIRCKPELAETSCVEDVRLKQDRPARQDVGQVLIAGRLPTNLGCLASSRWAMVSWHLARVSMLKGKTSLEHFLISDNQQSCRS